MEREVDARMAKTGTVAAVILAAGQSKRMGGVNKLLADLDGRPVIEWTVRAALDSEAADVVVVTGYQAERVGAALAGLDVRLVDNPDHAAGLSTSLRAGIEALGEGTAGAAVLLGDMPRVTPAVLDRLIACFRRKAGKVICRPVFSGRTGNPVLWPRDLFAAITAIEGDKGARQLLQTYEDRIVPVGVETDGIFFDVDEPGDLA